VTLANEGNMTFKIFGLTLHGEFNATRTWKKGWMDEMMDHETIEKIHPDTIPFKINGSSLIPLFGDRGDHDDDEVSSLILQPGENVTLSFSDVIALQPKMDFMPNPAMVITPIVGNNYTIRLMGEGFETFNVTATS
jgi:hypothetical protein